MGFFDFMMRRRENQTPAPEPITPPISDVLLQALINGETITREKALTLPAVSGAVDFICNSVASMPVKLYKYKNGKVEALADDPRVRLLNQDTGDTLDAFQLKKAMVEDYLLGKGGYCFIERSGHDVVSLRYVEEIYISVLKNFRPIFKDYVILVEGRQYEPWNFVKLLRNTKDGASGEGLVKEVSKALEAAYNMILYQLYLTKTGGSKKGFLKANRKLGQDEIDALKAAWKRLYSNSEENVIVLNNGLDFREASSTSTEMQLNESKRTFTDEINGLFHIYGDFELTFKMAIYPILKAFETALNRDLLLEKEKKNHFFEFDVKEIVKASLNERYAAYKTAKETGFMTLNEIRRAENMNYVDGLDVVNVGLGAVLYDVDKHFYFTPNTGETTDPNNPNPNPEMNPLQQKEQDMLEAHIEEQEFEQSGNSSV